MRYCEAWALLYDGEITPHDEEMGIGMIYGITYGEITCAMNDILTSIREVEINPPIDACCVIFKISNLAYQEGQISHPETGQWDFPPYYEMDIEILQYET